MVQANLGNYNTWDLHGGIFRLSRDLLFPPADQAPDAGNDADFVAQLTSHQGVLLSYLNTLLPGVEIRVGELSETRQEGMHTTTTGQLSSPSGVVPERMTCGIPDAVRARDCARITV